MPNQSYSLAPLLAEFRAEIRHRRDARAARRALRRDLASFTAQDELNDLYAILDRHSPDETAQIRRILAGRRAA
jgi:hypothetical protein